MGQLSWHAPPRGQPRARTERLCCAATALGGGRLYKVASSAFEWVDRIERIQLRSEFHAASSELTFHQLLRPAVSADGGAVDPRPGSPPPGGAGGIRANPAQSPMPDQRLCPPGPDRASKPVQGRRKALQTSRRAGPQGGR